MIKLHNIFFNLRNWATLILIIFCIRYIPIETREGVSIVKLIIAAICPLLFCFTPKINKGSMLILSYLLLITLTSFLHYESFRYYTIIYFSSFVFTYWTYYNLITEEGLFSFDYYFNIIKRLLLAYFIVLLIQQILILIGITQFPPFNLVQILNRGIGTNSLSGEPSTASRIMAVLFLSLLRMIEIKYNRKPTLKEIYSEAKLPFIGFIWSMLTMGSSTAFIALILLAFYFIATKYIIRIFVIAIIIAVIVPYIDFEALQRAIKALEASISFENKSIYSTDTSAAARIIPIINTLTNLDLTKIETWFGHGIDYNVTQTLRTIYTKNSTIGGIGDYGLFSFILMQLFIYKTSIRKLFSIETLFWIILFRMTLENVAFTWGAIMIFSTTKYFQLQYQCSHPTLEQKQ